MICDPTWDPTCDPKCDPTWDSHSRIHTDGRTYGLTEKVLTLRDNLTLVNAREKRPEISRISDPTPRGYAATATTEDR